MAIRSAERAHSKKVHVMPVVQDGEFPLASCEFFAQQISPPLHRHRVPVRLVGFIGEKIFWDDCTSLPRILHRRRILAESSLVCAPVRANLVRFPQKPQQFFVDRALAFFSAGHGR